MVNQSKQDYRERLFENENNSPFGILTFTASLNEPDNMIFLPEQETRAPKSEESF
jgi:hypothetical protein